VFGVRYIKTFSISQCVEFSQVQCNRKKCNQTNKPNKLSNRAEQYKKKSKLINRDKNQTNRDKQYPNQQRIQQSRLLNLFVQAINEGIHLPNTLEIKVMAEQPN
jgi:hypothetical protein